MDKNLPKGIVRVLISREEIEKRVRDLAAVIDSDYVNAKRPLVIIGVLKGSFIFLADLVRELKTPHVVDFIAVTSYGISKATRSSGSVRLLMDTREDLSGRDVIIVEDILDSGYTLEYLNRTFQARNPVSVRNVVLLDKPNRHEADVKIDYLGFSIPDVWVVGYGMDYAEKFRTLGYLAELDVKELEAN